MKIFGIDFTSRPRPGKPITCAEAFLDGDLLRLKELKEWPCFAEFEAALRAPGPWIAGIDFPFGQSRRFIENIGWPQVWADYVDHVGNIDRQEFRAVLDEYRKDRPAGDKEHRRVTDTAAGSISPQKLYGVPVALMFFEGAPRLRDAGVTIPGLQKGDPQKIVVEAYPGVLARKVIGRRSYKQDTRSKQTGEQRAARQDLLRAINNGALANEYGLEVSAPMSLVNDPTGDQLDALLCSIQAAWAWTQRSANYGAPTDFDAIEGWIADPKAKQRANKTPIDEKLLLDSGFKKYGRWEFKDKQIHLVGDIPIESGVYAHVVNEKVHYIGSATMGLKKRLYFYAKPGSTQKTSVRINGLIKEELKVGNIVELIAAFPTPSMWNGLPVDRVTGLESGLVRKFSPPWNKRGVAR